MDIARRLSSALYGATEKGTGLETADVNDQETLDKLRDEAPLQSHSARPPRAAASDVLPGNFPAGRLDGHPHGAPPEAQIRRVSPAVPLRRRRASAAAAKEKFSPELPSEPAHAVGGTSLGDPAPAGDVLRGGVSY